MGLLTCCRKTGKSLEISKYNYITQQYKTSYFNITSLQKEVVTYANQGDPEIFARITDVAKSHHKIQHFVEATGFRSRKSNMGLYTQLYSKKSTNF